MVLGFILVVILCVWPFEYEAASGCHGNGHLGNQRRKRHYRNKRKYRGGKLGQIGPPHVLPIWRRSKVTDFLTLLTNVLSSPTRLPIVLLGISEFH